MEVRMKQLRPAIGFAFAIAAASAAAGASPNFRFDVPRRTGVELLVAVPGAGSWHYRDPYFTRKPPVMVVPPPTGISPGPPSFFEQGSVRQPAPASLAGDWIYHCPTERGNYPQVRTCPQGWQLQAPPAPDLR
jgi:hypothetical protein